MGVDFDFKRPMLHLNRKVSTAEGLGAPKYKPSATSAPIRPPAKTQQRPGGVLPRSPKKYRKQPKKPRNYWRMISRAAFALALLAIVGVVVHFTFIPNAEQVNTYAMYAFFLLLIGTLSLALETKGGR